MGTFFGIFLAALVIAWGGVNVVRSLWFDVNNAVAGTTFIGLFTGTGTTLAMKKMKKTSRSWRPKIWNLRNAVNSLIRRG